MSMFNDIAWARKDGHHTECILNAREVSDHAKKFQRGHWSFLAPGDEEKWYGTCVNKPDGKWDQQANQMIELFAQRGHPVFRGMSALNTRNFEAKTRTTHDSLHCGLRKH